MILPSITKTQKLILFYLYKFRFLNTQQFQKLFNHKNPKRTQSWLKDLKEKGYIHMMYSRTTFGENTKPAIYYLGLKARHLLKQDENCNLYVLNKIYKEKQRDKKFINRCIIIADIYLFLLSQKEDAEEFYFFTEQDLVNYNYLPKELPTAYIALETKEETRRYFLELFDDYAPPFVFQNKVKQYLKYSREGRWEANTNNEAFPSLFFVCPSQNRKMHVYHYAKAVLQKTYDDKIDLFLTTKNTILFGAGKTNIWQKVE